MSAEYTDGEITVIWYKPKCNHVAKCVNGLPGVFNPKEKRWINVEGASPD
jgi:putative redox protein